MRLIDAEQWIEELENCPENNKDCNQWLINEIDSRHTVYTGDEDRTVRIVFSHEHWGGCHRCPSCGNMAYSYNTYCPGCGKLILWKDPEERADLSNHAWFILLQEQEKAKALNQKKLSELLYEKLCRLREYEKTGLTPDKVMELKAQQQSGGWIPCSERLPEESLNSVLGWDEYRQRCCFVQYYGGRWIFGNDIESVKITAWMPLPKPYKS